MDLREISFIAVNQINLIQDGGKILVDVLTVEHWGLYYQMVIRVYINHCCTAINAVTNAELCAPSNKQLNRGSGR
jgi:hypothetical protein